MQRLRMLQEKKEAQAKSARRDIATLLEAQKMEKARVKVESSPSPPLRATLAKLTELRLAVRPRDLRLLSWGTDRPTDPGARGRSLPPDQASGVAPRVVHDHTACACRH